VKTLYVIPGLECGQSHAYEVDIDIHALVLTGQAVCKLKEVKLDPGIHAKELIFDELSGLVPHEHA
jgi:hypothetical protein